MESLLILGRQPSLGLAELESLYGSAKLELLSRRCVKLSVDPCLVAFDRLGGSLKFAKILTTLPTTEWAEIEQFLADVAPQQASKLPDGRLKLGLSLYGFNLSPKEIIGSGLKLKKVLQASGRKVRFVPNKAAELSSAQVIHHDLTKQMGWELLFIRSGTQTTIAQTVKVQDIKSYSKRDRERPKHDPKVGMLPPKLAQMMINLGVGQLSEERLSSICDIPADQLVPAPQLNQTILDPFCGSGGLLIEARLMGYAVCGSDINQRMVDYTRANLAWLGENYRLSENAENFEVADATKHRWRQDFDFVISEAYLGPPFSSLPSDKHLNQAINNVQPIIKQFLINLRSQLSPGQRLCLAVPAWQISAGKLKTLPLIDQISDLGYNLVSFKHVKAHDLAYYRPDQVVARQLLVLTRK